MKAGKWRTIGLFALILVLNIPARLLYIRAGLWLDEAWVANSVLQPSLREMFYYDRWVQTTPPLTLMLMRAAVMLRGPGEIAFRVVPLIAGIAAMAVFAAAARKTLHWPFSLIAATFFATNYWAIRYSQEAKQYGCDQLAACACLFVVVSLVLRRSRWNAPTLALLAATMILISLPALFFLPSLVLATALRRPAANKQASAREKWQNWSGAAYVLFTGLAVFGASWVFFWRINGIGKFAARMSHYSGSGSNSSAFLQKVIQNMAELMLPNNFQITRIFSGVILLLAGAGALAAICGSLRNHRQSGAMLLAGVLPPVSALMPAILGFYPLAPHPRLILWMLPSLVLLASGAGLLAHKFAIRSLRVPWIRGAFGYATTVGCITISCAGFFFIQAAPRSLEENGRAVRFLAASLTTGDRVFLHGGLYEQFELYSEIIAWRPSSIYVANLGWPCCAVGMEKRVSNPRALTLADDVASGLRDLHSGRVWVLTPSGGPGHWSNHIEDQLHEIPALMAAQGCLLRKTDAFGETDVTLFQCESTVTRAVLNVNAKSNLPR